MIPIRQRYEIILIKVNFETESKQSKKFHIMIIRILISVRKLTSLIVKSLKILNRKKKLNIKFTPSKTPHRILLIFICDNPIRTSTKILIKK